jgi:hypothetical protein
MAVVLVPQYSVVGLLDAESSDIWHWPGLTGIIFNSESPRFRQVPWPVSLAILLYEILSTRVASGEGKEYVLERCAVVMVSRESRRETITHRLLSFHGSTIRSNSPTDQPLQPI